MNYELGIMNCHRSSSHSITGITVHRIPSQVVASFVSSWVVFMTGAGGLFGGFAVSGIAELSLGIRSAG